MQIYLPLEIKAYINKQILPNKKRKLIFYKTLLVIYF